MGLKYKSTETWLKPDPKYRSVLVEKITNCLMLAGKKTIAQKIVYGAMERAEKQLQGMGGLEILEKAVNTVKPAVETKSRRVGGSNFQVPVSVSKKRAQSLALRWLVQAARSRKGRSMADLLCQELVDACNKRGAAYEKRENVHKMAEANKAFAHLAW